MIVFIIIFALSLFAVTARLQAWSNILTLKYHEGTNLSFFDFILIEEFR